MTLIGSDLRNCVKCVTRRAYDFAAAATIIGLFAIEIVLLRVFDSLASYYVHCFDD